MTSSQVRQSSLETTQYFYIKHILIAISDLFFTGELTTAFKQQPGYPLREQTNQIIQGTGEN